MSYKIGFIGAGNMGGCLIEASLKTLNSNEICVYDTDCSKTEKFEKNYGIASCKLEDVLDSQIVVMGVKPQVFKTVADSIKSKLCARNDDFTIVSMAAGITIDSICEMFSKRIPVIRIMPNMACNTGEGIVVYDVNELVSEKSEKQFCEVFSKVGLLDKIDEKLIDAACCITGCGPAFAYMFIESLADGAVACGLPRDKSVKYATQMLMGAAKTVTGDVHTEELKDRVCSPGGSTIEGVIALEKMGFRGAVNSAVMAAFEKNKALGKKKS